MKTNAILIIDDHPEKSLTLEHLSGGIPVVRAQSGAGAVKKALDNDVSLILLDIEPSNTDAYDTAERLVKNPNTRHIPIIALTPAVTDRERRLLGHESAAVDVLVKPLEPEILKGRIRFFLELFRQRSELEENRRTIDARNRETEDLRRELEATQARLRILSSLDGLTGLPNRRIFDETLKREWKRAARTHKPLALILADIDHFRAYNDFCGHLDGDQCLKQVAAGLAGALLREIDTIVRYGGEVFAAILPETGLSGAEQIARRMIDAVASLAIPHKASPTGPLVTVSLGIASLVPGPGMIPGNLIDHADRALAMAKNTGRNRYYAG